MAEVPGGEPLRVDRRPSLGPVALTLGAFDGVHRGHRSLLATVRRAARERAAAAVALVLDPHPDEVVRPGTVVPRLTSPVTTRELVAQAGIEHALPLRFDRDLMALTPERFLDALAPALELRALVMTPESALGARRAGTPERMAELGRERGFEVVVAPLVELDGEPISASRVRAAVAAADLVTATGMLGRPPMVEGTVVHGDGRGRRLGFPTANLDPGYTPCLPPLGIYAGTADCDVPGVRAGHPSLISVGVRPTFGAGRLLTEVYLLDFDGDLYGATLRASVEPRLREERRYDDVGALVAQMRVDEADARRLLGA
jgi:riboflavin kinase/FMN adenylyltransferase